MKIKKIHSQNRRDFTATLYCEYCEAEEEIKDGYDDRYYHDNVIPNMKCCLCEKSTISGGQEIEKTETKYPEGFQI